MWLKAGCKNKARGLVPDNVDDDTQYYAEVARVQPSNVVLLRAQHFLKNSKTDER